MVKIDINADLGEGTGNDALIMPLVSSCNIACGGHYGTAATILTALKLAKLNNVNVGAHPSYPDMANFGRKRMDISNADLKIALDIQLKVLIDASDSLAMSLHHIKPHGALYNVASVEEETAKIVLRSILDTGLLPVLYAPKNSALYNVAKDHLPISCEVFVDRRYTDELQLVSRDQDDAIINSPDLAWEQLKMIVNQQRVKTITGKVLSIEGQTFCVHGDASNVLQILEFIHLQMKNHAMHLKR